MNFKEKVELAMININTYLGDMGENKVSPVQDVVNAGTRGVLATGYYIEQGYNKLADLAKKGGKASRG